MIPRKDDEALVDVLDVLLRDGAVLRADVIVSVAEIPLVGIKLTAAIAGMETMTEYGLFEQWDVERRQTALTRRQYKRDRPDRDRPSAENIERITVGNGRDETTARDENGDGDGDGADSE